MPGQYTLVEHTADLRLRGEGNHPAEVVAAMLAGLTTVLFGREIAARPTRWVSWRPPEGLPPPLALVELLQEALYAAATGGEVAVAFEGELSSGRLGFVPLPGGVEPIREVKAVTYNDARFERLPAGTWAGEVTLDL